MEHKLSLRVPLKTETQARAVYNALRPDPELRPKEVSKELRYEGSVLLVEFRATTERELRASANGFMDVLREALEGLSVFDPEYYEQNECAASV